MDIPENMGGVVVCRVKAKHRYGHLKKTSMASKNPLPDPILSQIPYLPWIWGNDKNENIVMWALQQLSIDRCNVEAWGCLASMVLEDPFLHLQVLHRIRCLVPDDKNNEARITSYSEMLAM